MLLKELEMTAQLARLKMSTDELAALFPAFEQMLGFFAVMKEADDDPENACHGTYVGAGHFRADVGRADDALVYESDVHEKMLNNAGKRDGRFIVIPNVL